MVPDRLSYTEMALNEFKYPNIWTQDYTNYVKHKGEVTAKIIDYMENYEDYLTSINKQVYFLHKNYFSGAELYGVING